MHAGFGIDVYAVGLRSCQKSPLSRTYHLTLRSRMQSGTGCANLSRSVPSNLAGHPHPCLHGPIGIYLGGKTLPEIAVNDMAVTAVVSDAVLGLQQHHQRARTALCGLRLHKGYHFAFLHQPLVHFVLEHRGLAG